MFNLLNKFYNQMYKKDLSLFDMFDFYAKCMLLIAVLSRFSFAALAIMISLKTPDGYLLSPFFEIRSGDYDFYLQASSESFALLKEPFLFFYQGGSFDAWIQRSLAPGPLFPWLLYFLNYPDQPIILASVYLILSSFLIFGWVIYYRARDVSLWGQLALIAFPLILWYSMALSTELPMSIALFIFFCASLAIRQMPYWAVPCALIGFILMLLTRPNSVSLFPVILLVIFINRDVMSRWIVASIVVLITFLGLYFFVYYAPYFFYVNEAANSINYWGLFPQQYSEGLFPNLPFLLDQLISNGALIVSKFFYASGLRPSYTDSSILFVFLRGIGGIWFLPGIFYCIYRGSWFERVLLLCYLFPLFITVAQERYLIPIAPLLLLYGGIFWKDLYLFTRKGFCS